MAAPGPAMLPYHHMQSTNYLISINYKESVRVRPKVHKQRRQTACLLTVDLLPSLLVLYRAGPDQADATRPDGGST